MSNLCLSSDLTEYMCKHCAFTVRWECMGSHISVFVSPFVDADTINAMLYLSISMSESVCAQTFTGAVHCVCVCECVLNLNLLTWL